MDWNIRWLIIGGCAFILTIINLVRTLQKKNSGWEILMFCSLSLGVFAVLEEYQMVNQWLKWGEWSAAENAVPHVAVTLTWAAGVGILLNLMILFANLKRNKSYK